MRNTTAALMLAFSLGFTTTAASSDESVLAEGKVVAIQKAKDEVRMLDNTDADLVEVWMVRVEHWPGLQKPGIVLVEYTTTAS